MLSWLVDKYKVVLHNGEPAIMFELETGNARLIISKVVHIAFGNRGSLEGTEIISVPERVNNNTSYAELRKALIDPGIDLTGKKEHRRWFQ